MKLQGSSNCFFRIKKPHAHIISEEVLRQAQGLEAQESSKDHLDNSAGSQGKINDLHEKSLKFATDKEEVYREWAGLYDAGVASQSYNGPLAVAQKLIGELDLNDVTTGTTGRMVRVLDAGCGTGLVGQALIGLGSASESPTTSPSSDTSYDILLDGYDIVLHGCDISHDMMEIAHSRGYSELKWCDLNKPLDMYKQVTYDAITIVGTFTWGHVGPSPAIPELLSLLSPDGVLVATVRQSFYEEMGFAEVLNEACANGKCVVEITRFQYLEGVVANLVVIRKVSV